jgi:M6 family metalloprotease-like protein
MNLPLKLIQPDGTELNVLASGDEYYNWVHDRDNYTILQNESGWYVYAEPDGDDIIPGTLIVGKDSPMNLAPGVNRSETLIAERYRNIKARMPEGRNPCSPSIGTFNNLVIFIKFAGDPEFTVPFSLVDQQFNDQGTTANSVKRYYLDSSYNQLTIDSYFYPPPQGDAILSYTDINPRGYYEPYSATNPIGYEPGEYAWLGREQQLLIRAVNAVLQYIPASLDVDADEDGYVDNLCFIVQGNYGGWAELLWPHQYNLYDPTCCINGAIVGNYNLNLEAFLTDDYGVSSSVHELFHSLSAPDLYRYTNTNITPIGKWDLMASDTSLPQQTSAWMKYKYGHWVSAPIPIVQSGTYTLHPVGASSTNISYRIGTWRPGEYYILEYRKPCGLIDSMVPGTGLLVYRLLLDVEGNSNGPPDGLYVYRPYAGNTNSQGSLYSAGLSSQSGFTAINETTVPSGFTSINTPGGLNLYDVGEAGETITFKVKVSDIQLTAPLGDDVWISGSDQTIRWLSKNNTGNVKIEFSPDLGQSWSTLVESVPNSGTWLWRYLPFINSSECLVKISLLGSYHYDICTYPFMISTSLASPDPVFPPDQATGVPTNPLLSWQRVPGASHYAIQLSADPGFASCLLNVPSHPDSSYQVSGLAPYMTYFWRVASVCGVVNSGFCPAQGFTTGEITEVPGSPALVSPAHNSVGQSLTPLLEWTGVALASSYRVQLSHDAYFSELVCDTTIVQQHSFVAPALSPLSIYFWRVAASNIAGSSNFSGAWKFTTGDGSGIDEDISIANVNLLLPIYPNPFVSSANISFSLRQAAVVSARIFNVRGQLVREFGDMVYSSGIHSIPWDGRENNGETVSSGIYYIKVDIGTETHTRKILVIK